MELPKRIHWEEFSKIKSHKDLRLFEQIKQICLGI